MIDHLRNAFQEKLIPESHQATDKLIISFKGRHSAKMYMPKKWVKWGYELWYRASIYI